MATKQIGVQATQRKSGSDIKDYDVSVGNIDKSSGEHEPKPKGMVMRGTGAATKGKMFTRNG